MLWMNHWWWVSNERRTVAQNRDRRRKPDPGCDPRRRVAGGRIHADRPYPRDAEPARPYLCGRSRHHPDRSGKPQPRRAGSDAPGQPCREAADRNVRRPERFILDPGLGRGGGLRLYRRRAEEGAHQAYPRPLRVALQCLRKTPGGTGAYQVAARGSQGHREGQGHPDEGEGPNRGRGLCAAALHRDAREEEKRRDRPVDSDRVGDAEMTAPLRIGFIPLVDAAALMVAVDKGYATAEGLDVTLVREVSWSNVRDKLNIGLFDAAHLLAPVAIASSLGLGHIKVPIVAPFNLGLNGNAITVSPALHAAIMGEIEGDPFDPMATALALCRVVAARRKSGAEPLTFGMTFPFSTHNYQLRFWMAAGGVDPDEDVRLVVLPPPYVVDSLANGHVDAFCVGAPWNSVAVDLGVGHILHFVSDILVRAAEKVLAVRQSWSERNPDILAALIRAHLRAVEFIEDSSHRAEAARILAQPERIGVDADVILRSLEGRLKISPDGTMRESSRYLLVGREGASRPDPVQAAWLYAQMVRWGQASISPEALEMAKAVFRPDLYDAALGLEPGSDVAHEDVGAFAGPAFDPDDVAGHLASFKIARQKL